MNEKHRQLLGRTENVEESTAARILASVKAISSDIAHYK